MLQKEVRVDDPWIETHIHDQRFEDRESLGCIPVYTEQVLQPREDKYFSFIYTSL